MNNYCREIFYVINDSNCFDWYIVMRFGGGLLVGLGINFFAMIKYNKGIF